MPAKSGISIFHQFYCHYQASRVGDKHYIGGGGSDSVTAPGHYGDHPRPQVADRGTPSRMVKRVAPDKEGAADNQSLGEGKL